ncbi:MAG: hypothetical protein ACI81R_000455 [Bradymonadia bacterium]|jgi:hypothetical protein
MTRWRSVVTRVKRSREVAKASSAIVVGSGAARTREFHDAFAVLRRLGMAESV